MGLILLLEESSQAAISAASCSDPTHLLEKKSLLSSGIISAQWNTGEGSQVMVAISQEVSYIVMTVVVAVVMVVAGVEAVVVVGAHLVVAEVVLTVVVVADVVVAGVVVAAVGVAVVDVAAMVVATWVVVAVVVAKSRRIPAVVVVQDSSKYMALQSAAAMSLTSAKCILVTGCLQECLRKCGVYT